MKEASERINDLIREQYNTLDEQNAIVISPASLARCVYENLDPKARSPIDVQFLAVLQLRQMARKICASRNHEDETTQEPLFDGQLQPRYPTNRPDSAAETGYDRGYVKREFLTLKERRAIIERLKLEATAKKTHAEALEAETAELLRRGILHEEDAA